MMTRWFPIRGHVTTSAQGLGDLLVGYKCLPVRYQQQVGRESPMANTRVVAGNQRELPLLLPGALDVLIRVNTVVS